jgi:hypothetical protein
LKHNLVLTITSLLSILLFSFHLSDDIVRGFEPGDFRHIIGLLILIVWLYATLVLAGRRSGYIIMFLLAFLASFVPLIHMRGRGLVGGSIANSSGVFFWVWTLLAVGVTAPFSVILSARGLWSLPWRRRRPSGSNNA